MLSRFTEATQLITNVVVIVSVIFLAVEIRQNSTAIKAQTFQDRAFFNSEFLFATGESEYFSKLFLKTSSSLEQSNDLSGLSEEEKMRLTFWESAVLRSYENNLYQCELGYLDNEFCNAFENRIRSKGEYWAKLLGEIPEDFSRVRRLVREDT